jgi:hypothetical protein
MAVLQGLSLRKQFPIVFLRPGEKAKDIPPEYGKSRQNKAKV